ALLYRRRMEWKYFAADLCCPDFPVAEIDLCSRRKLYREMVRIEFGYAANRRRADKDQPRRSADTVTESALFLAAQLYESILGGWVLIRWASASNRLISFR